MYVADHCTRRAFVSALQTKALEHANKHIHIQTSIHIPPYTCAHTHTHLYTAIHTYNGFVVRLFTLLLVLSDVPVVEVFVRGSDGRAEEGELVGQVSNPQRLQPSHPVA